jgi:hypothetical protein
MFPQLNEEEEDDDGETQSRPSHQRLVPVLDIDGPLAFCAPSCAVQAVRAARSAVACRCCRGGRASGPSTTWSRCRTRRRRPPSRSSSPRSPRQ